MAEEKIVIDEGLDLAIDELVSFIDAKFEIQPTIVDAIPADEQIRDVVVLTVVKAVDTVMEAKEIEGVRGLSSLRGGVSVVTEDDEGVPNITPYPAINPEGDLVSNLAYIIQEISDIYDLDIKEVAGAIEDAEIKMPVGFSNDAMDNKTISDYTMDI